MMNMPTTSPSVLAAFASNLNFRICTLMCFLLFLLLLLENPPSFCSSSLMPDASMHVWLPLNAAIGSFEHDEVNEACNEEVVDTVGLPMWSDDGYEMDILIFSFRFELVRVFRSLDEAEAFKLTLDCVVFMLSKFTAELESVLSGFVLLLPRWIRSVTISSSFCLFLPAIPLKRDDESRIFQNFALTNYGFGIWMVVFEFWVNSCKFMRLWRLILLILIINQIWGC